MKYLMNLILVLGLPCLGTAQVMNSTGKVIVLENEKTLDGDIEKVGEQFRIRRALGETWIPASQVLMLCKNNEDAYKFVRGRSNLNDPDERIKLAHWCHMHGLEEEALQEVQAAVDLRPDHSSSKRLLKNLQQQRQEVKAGRNPGTSPVLQQTGRIPDVELTGEALSRFSSHVQPILMNSCASCHATGRGGNFRLVRSDDNANSRATQFNAASVLSQVNMQQPESSLFLTRALTLHGTMNQPPFRNRQSPAYRALEEWVQLSVVSKPSGGPSSSGGDLANRTPPASSLGIFANGGLQPPPIAIMNGPGPVPVAVTRPVNSDGQTEKTTPGNKAAPTSGLKGTQDPMVPAKKPEPEDNFDGENFNRLPGGQEKPMK